MYAHTRYLHNTIDGILIFFELIKIVSVFIPIFYNRCIMELLPMVVFLLICINLADKYSYTYFVFIFAVNHTQMFNITFVCCIDIYHFKYRHTTITTIIQFAFKKENYFKINK